MRRPVPGMAETLRYDLLARGIAAPTLGECEAIIARLAERARADNDDDTPPQRCDTGEADLDASCMACGAREGETCRRHQNDQ